MTLQLAADGHPGLVFEPGQFARLRLAQSPYSLDEHPFTLSSSANHPDRPAFTFKALGDFNTSVAGLPVGIELLVDGPHGEGFHIPRWPGGRPSPPPGSASRPPERPAHGGERCDPEPILLVYGSRSWAETTFREELADLGRRLAKLEVVHVLSRPEPGWLGERGLLTRCRRRCG